MFFPWLNKMFGNLQNGVIFSELPSHFLANDCVASLSHQSHFAHAVGSVHTSSVIE